VQAALTMLHNGVKLPKPDFGEPNDGAGSDAHPFGPPRTIAASLDFWDDPLDVYSLRLEKGRQLFVRLSPSSASAVSLVLWKPGTQHVDGSPRRSRSPGRNVSPWSSRRPAPTTSK
jgi:hypothetical protein